MERNWVTIIQEVTTDYRLDNVNLNRMLVAACKKERLTWMLGVSRPQEHYDGPIFSRHTHEFMGVYDTGYT